MIFTNRLLSNLIVKQVSHKSFITFANSVKRYLFTKMPKTALVLLANGTEELEFVTIANVLRRGEVRINYCTLHAVN